MAWDDVVTGGPVRAARRTGRWDDVAGGRDSLSGRLRLGGAVPFADSSAVPELSVPVFRPRGDVVLGPPPRAMESAGGATPFAESRSLPEVARPQTFVVSGPPQEGPRAALETMRSAGRGMPVVEGTVMRRGAPGSGEYGEGLDLSPRRVVRDTPMTLEEGVRAGIVKFGKAPTFTQVGRAPTGPNAGMGMTAEADRAAQMAATRGERWGYGTGGASGPTSAINRRSQSIIDAQRADEAADKAASRAAALSQGTPQAVSGEGGTMAWDPVSRSWSAQAVKTGPKGFADMSDDALIAANVKYGRPARATPKDLDAINANKYTAAMTAGDTATAGRILDTYTKEWTEEEQTAQQLIAQEMRRRGIGGKGKGGPSSAPSVAAEGKGRRTEDGGRRTEDGWQRTEGMTDRAYTQQEAQSLPKGTVYLGTDGKRHRRA